MTTSKVCALALAGFLLPATAFAAGGASGVVVKVNDAEHKVDVMVDGKPFTTYLWKTNQRKPLLYPIMAPDGTIVTRGYPFVTIEGERVDHPHHVGLWFNYSSVNHIDFWDNSDGIKPELRAKFGSIDHDRIVTAKSGPTSGELVTESTWYPASDVPAVGSNQTPPVLHQTTRYAFSKLTVDGKPARAIDLTITLKALSPVTFFDEKDGMLGLRVAHFLEAADAQTGGVPETPGATGVYRTSEGIVGDKVWSTRGRWCELSGTTPDGKPETVAIVDHPGNPNYPTYWHARGYGLFAANPLGAHSFDTKAEPLNFSLDTGKSATFRYRVLIFSSAPSPEDLNAQADSWAKAQ